MRLLVLLAAVWLLVSVSTVAAKPISNLLLGDQEIIVIEGYNLRCVVIDNVRGRGSPGVGCARIPAIPATPFTIVAVQ